MKRRNTAMAEYSKPELQEALRSIASTIAKCEKVLPKLNLGTSQHTLLTRRIRSFQIASALIAQALKKSEP
jgi:hypothetical protein